MILIGPSAILGIPDEIGISIAGLCFMGFGAGMIIIPVLPDMIEATEERYPGVDMNQLHNSISGLFIAAQGLGETLGPVTGSVFKNISNYRSSTDIMGAILIAFMTILYFTCGRNWIFSRVFKKEEGRITEALLSSEDKHI